MTVDAISEYPWRYFTQKVFRHFLYNEKTLALLY